MLTGSILRFFFCLLLVALIQEFRWNGGEGAPIYGNLPDAFATRVDASARVVDKRRMGNQYCRMGKC